MTANESDLPAQGSQPLAIPMTSLHCASSKRSARYCSTMRQAQNPTCPVVAAFNKREELASVLAVCRQRA